MQAEPNAVNGAGMKDFLLQFFTWWNGQTLGTRFQIWRKGELVGTDESRQPLLPDARRRPPLGVYNGAAEPSRDPARLARLDAPPQPTSRRRPISRASGRSRISRTSPARPQAYRPPGSILGPAPRTPGTPDYEAWQP